MGATLAERVRRMLEIPPAPGLAAAAPILCTGVTTYSPVKH